MKGGSVDKVLFPDWTNIAPLWLVVAFFLVVGGILGFWFKNRWYRDTLLASLKTTDQKTRAIFDLSFEFLGLLSPEGILLDVNQTALNFIGMTASKVIGKPFWETPWWSFSEETQNDIKKAIKTAATGKIFHGVTTHIDKNGKEKTIDYTVKPVMDRDGKVRFLIPEGRDITEKKMAEEALKQSEYFFKESQRAAFIGSYRADFEKGFWESSEVLDKIFGIDKTYKRSIQGWLDLVAPEDKEMMGKYLKESVLTKHRPFNKEYRVKRRSDGKIRWVLGLGKVKVNAKGKAVGLIGTIQDINEQKLAEMKMEELNQVIIADKQRMEAILRDLGDAVLVTDEKKKIIMTNMVMERFLGKDIKGIIGKTIDDIVPLYYESSGKKPYELFNKVLKSNKPIKPAELLVLSKAGDTKTYIDGVGSPVMMGKKLIGTVWIFRDVTKQKETDKMKTDFISLASHQLRTPLTGIKWFVELLEEMTQKKEEKRELEYVQKIGISNERMISLVNDLITTSKSDSGKLLKEIGRHSVKDLLLKAIEEQGRIFSDKKIQIVGLDSILEDCEVEVDAIQITQVLGNLLNNAVNYSGVGSKIDIKVEAFDKKVKIAIKDQGLGIPKSQQEKMFSKFFRADNVSRTIPGSGLGLYVAKSIIENHQGKIWFESEENKGTTFFVELPKIQTEI